jgi:hypothetical protein
MDLNADLHIEKKNYFQKFKFKLQKKKFLKHFLNLVFIFMVLVEVLDMMKEKLKNFIFLFIFLIHLIMIIILWNIDYLVLKI